MIEILKRQKIEFLENASVKEYTTLHIGGRTRLLMFPKNEEEAQCILAHCNPIILGRGSNVLMNDQVDLDAVMILTHMRHMTQQGNRIIADAGASLMDVCLFAYEKGLSGLEFAYGIPGSVGGAVMMNAGAYGGEIKDVVYSIVSNKAVYENGACQFGYRHSVFSDNGECILRAVFQLREGHKELIGMKMKELITKRIEKQPLDKYSAGSTFKRGSDFYASQLINECGLKGMRVKDAAVSQKHAGFLINEGNASYHDFQCLIKRVQQKVYEKTGKQLECEVKIIGGEYDLCE